jgi:formylglycine-generating enzyme required for sulfatase activity
MKTLDWKKTITIIVLLTFATTGLAWAAKQSMPRFQEKERAPLVKKHRRFPWLPVILGVGAGVALVVLLTRTKKQTLTVNLNVGTSGTPAATAKYKKGSVVNYNYTPKTGFHSLQVRLDGAAVPPSGTVTMDRDHTLDVSAGEEFTLAVSLGAGTSGTPAVTTVYPRDEVVHYSYSALSSVDMLQVRIDNVVVVASGTVTMSTNHALSVSITTTIPVFSNGVLTINGIRYEMALIPAGEFQMGSVSPVADFDEQPVHGVLISKAFWLGKTEVTQALWQAVMGSNPSKFKGGGDYPVEEARWEESRDFIASLNQMLGSDLFRFPTEAEWEYACRAGTTGERYGELDAIAWYLDNAGSHTHPVGLKQPNAFGLYDMLGNVWEWCRDIYCFPYPSSYQVDPIGCENIPNWSGRVYRGGSWETPGSGVRSPQRDRDHPNETLPLVSVGLRLARTKE